MNRLIATFVTLSVIALGVAATASADVVRVDVESRADVAGGMAYGLAGPYEKLAGMVHFEVDPANPANRIVTDIDFAPRNDRGMVEFRSNFFLLKPKDAARGNGTVLYEVSNRGGKGMLGYFNNAAGSRDPQTAEEMGDGFLLQNGFSLLWLGWQFDVPVRDGQMRLHTPVAADGDNPLTGLVRSEVIVNERTWDRSLADRNHIAYPVADPDDPANVMTVRDGVDQPRRVVPRDQWRFARRNDDGSIVDDPTRVYLEGGFEPFKIYDVVYVAKDPALVGLGPAAVRDMISKLKYEATPELGLPAGAIEHAVAWGVSQSGRFLRTFLHHGYNVDEQNRRAFDGVMSHVAGGGRGSFNHRFAQPSRDGHPFLNKLYPSDIFPFTDVVQHDPETDMRDGLLAGIQPGHMPKVFYTNSSYEYWGRAASLIHTTIDGTADAPLLDNVRIYSFAGGQHGPGRFPPRLTSGQELSNPNDYSWFLRPLLLAMDRWIDDDAAAPPASVYPRIADDDLVPPEKLGFPELPGVGQPAVPHLAYRAVYGPEFRTRGIASEQPPEVLSAFPILVPSVDADGNETGGLMMPEVAVPLATYTGWNLFHAEAGPTDVLSSMQGSYVPFPRTADDRERTGDPRSSIQERYGSRAEYLGRVTEAALALVEDGYLLAGDLAPILAQAARHWDYLMEEDTGNDGQQ
ncbi:MAG: hypothetical protein J4G16_06435 [Acidobacteria bacterium]|nr:hypothetical protein [Acidobacteriota bacterium]